MALETGTYISDLVITNPTSSDPKSQGDDHFRLLKSTVKTTFPNVTGAVTPTHTELNYVGGVTSGIQAQIDLKAPINSPTLTGTPTGPTAVTGTTGAQLATLDFVNATSLAGTLPGQGGNAGKILTTDGANAGWDDTIDGSVVTLATGGSIVGTTETQSLSNKSLTTPVIQDSSDNTKKANFVLSSVTAGQNRNITIADENMTLFTPGWKLLSTITASNSATVDIESPLTSTYDAYKIIFSGVTRGASSANLYVRFKKAGAYISTTTYSYDDFTGASHVGTAQIVLTTTSITATGVVDGELTIHDPENTSRIHGVMISGIISQSTLGELSIAGLNSTTGALEGIRFFLSAGNIATGTFRVFGMRSS